MEILKYSYKIKIELMFLLFLIPFQRVNFMQEWWRKEKIKKSELVKASRAIFINNSQILNDFKF